MGKKTIGCGEPRPQVMKVIDRIGAFHFLARINSTMKTFICLFCSQGKIAYNCLNRAFFLKFGFYVLFSFVLLAVVFTCSNIPTYTPGPHTRTHTSFIHTHTHMQINVHSRSYIMLLLRSSPFVRIFSSQCWRLEGGFVFLCQLFFLIVASELWTISHLADVLSSLVYNAPPGSSGLQL